MTRRGARTIRCPGCKQDGVRVDERTGEISLHRSRPGGPPCSMACERVTLPPRPGLATCPVCQNEVTITARGKLRAHPFDPPHCSGSGRLAPGTPDDLDGSDAVELVGFILDGERFELNLSAANAARLRQALDPYIENARPRQRHGLPAAA